MTILSALTNAILPVFAIMAIGFFLGRIGRITVETGRHINTFVMFVPLPLMLINFISKTDPAHFDLIPVLLYVAVQAVVFAGGFWLAARVFGCGGRESVLLAFSGVFANNAFYVLPISVILYGADNVLPVTTIITLDAVVAFGGVVIVLQVIELGQPNFGAVVKRLASAPILQGIVVGILFVISGLEMPAPVQTFLDFNSVAAAPAGLFALGVVLSGTSFAFSGVVSAFTGIKLLVFPTLIWAALHIDAGSAGAHPLYVLAAAGPAGSMGFSLAILHGVRSDRIAQVMVWSTVFSLITLSALA